MHEQETMLSKFLTNINHTLSIANKALPVYEQAKPLVKKGIDTYNNMKTNNINIPKAIKLIKLKNNLKKDIDYKSIPDFTYKKNKKYDNSNNPTFFI